MAKRQMESGDSDADDCAAPPASKQKCISGDNLSGLKRKRFAEPTSYVELLELGKKSEKVIPRNTRKNDNWALRAFEEWISERNERCDDEKCPEHVLETEDANCLSKWLSLFTIEARKKDGSKYPPTTLHMLLCGLQRIMRRRNSHPFDIFSKKDVRFRGFQSTMESVFQNLHKEGVGAEAKRAEAISTEEEAALWEKGIIGATSPLALARAIFYLNGKHFSLKGGQKHRQLKLSQFQRENDHWQYTERRSHGGSVGDVRVVRQFPCPSAGIRCHVRLLDLYVSKLPQEAREKDAAFYFTELKYTPEDPTKPWFTAVPMGWNKLDRMVKNMFKEAGIDGKSNHSLYVTTRERNCSNGVSEKTILSQTGHKSVEALQVCERPYMEQDQDVQSPGQHHSLVSAEMPRTLRMKLSTPPPLVPILPPPPPRPLLHTQPMFHTLPLLPTDQQASTLGQPIHMVPMVAYPPPGAFVMQQAVPQTTDTTMKLFASAVV